MTWVRAADLKIGMRTSGGLVVSDITVSGPMFNVKWTRQQPRYGKTIGYHPDQSFDIAETAPREEETNMAQKVSIEVTSDLSDKPGAATVEFALDGRGYEIDLTDKEAEAFRGALARYVGAARTVTGAGGRGAARKRSAVQSGPPASEIRAWAQANGHEVPNRGRIPSEVRQAYDAAH